MLDSSLSDFVSMVCKACCSSKSLKPGVYMSIYVADEDDDAYVLSYIM